MTFKKIIRWTIGDINQDGLDCLKKSIFHFSQLYPDFDQKICFNKLDDKWLNLLKSNYSNIEFIDQSQHINSLKIPPIPSHSCWKLYPPRLDINSYEIFIDNDLIIFNHLDEVKELLTNNMPFITESMEDNSYGIYDRFVPFGLKINAGLFGIPPQFDLQKKIEEKIIAYWKYYLDEQGIMAYIFSREKFNLINRNKIPICHEKLPYQLGTHGMHFVGLNRGFNQYWKRYDTT